MDSSQLSAASGMGRISQQPLQYPLRVLSAQVQASASAVDIEAHLQPAQSLMLQRRGFQRTSREPNLDDTAAQRRHSHRRNIALQLAALNVLTHISFVEKCYQLPHTTSRGDYERFEKLITDGERYLSDCLVERTDLAFDIELSEYINSLSVEDINLSINDEATAQYYENLIDGYHRVYRASAGHCTLVQRPNNTNIPPRFDYCDSYQGYVATVFEEHQTNRKRLKAAMNRAGQLLSAIRTAMVDESLDDATLARLKLKLTALQVNYPEAYQTVHGGSQRDLFDPSAEKWWNTAEVTAQRNTAQVTAQRNTAQVTVQRNTAKTRSTLGFVVPTCCILSCIPAFLAWRCSPPGPGTTGDSTFYELLTGLVIQALGLGTMLWPALSSKKLGRHPRMYAVVLAVASIIFMLASVPMYLWVSVGWGPAFSWLGAVAQTLVLLQLTDEFLR